MADPTVMVTGDTNFSDLLRDCAGLGRDCLIARLRADQRARWLRGRPLSVEAYREHLPALAADAEALLDLIYCEVLLREEMGTRPEPAEYQRRFPEHAESLARQFELHRALETSSLGGLASADLTPRPAHTTGQTLASSGDQRADESLTDADADGRAAPGAQIAVPGYEILGELGRGGMGVVYMARQTKLNRTVALKMVLAGGHAGPTELVRFLAEAEAAAALQHPNIVQIYEIGQHERLPYFSLEYCPGGTLAQKLDGSPQPPRAAAELIETLARAIQHAHDKGIVHRDLKPANILFAEDHGGKPRGSPSTSEPRGLTPWPDFTPKITDFGLAKRVESESGLTRSGAFLGTPSYMAPEQAAGQSRAVSPAADIYALGAILYELLTGRPPFRGVDALETLEQVRTREPLPPRQLQPKLPKDLETVCLKCLRKEPEKRYLSAAALADDLRRFLDGRTVTARPVPGWVRAAKWVRRQPAWGTLIGVGTAAVIALVAGALWHNAQLAEALEATKEERSRADEKAAEARVQQRKAEEVGKFLVDLFVTADPLGLDSAGLGGARGGGEPLTAQQLIERAEDRLKTELHDQPLVRAEVLHTLGHLARTLGDLPRAEHLLTEAVALREKLLSPDDPALAASLHHLGWLRHEQGELDAADNLFRRALAIRREQFGPNAPATVDTLLHLGWLTTVRDDYEEAERLLQEVLSLRLTTGAAERDVAIARLGLIALYLDQGERDKAVPLLKEVAPYIQKSAGDQLLDQAVAKFQAAVMLHMTGLPRLAVRRLEESRDLVIKRFGPRHLYVALVLYQLGLALGDTGDLDRAEATWRDCLAIARERGVLPHPKSTVLYHDLANLLSRRGKAGEAEDLYRELLQIHSAHSGGRFLSEAQFYYAGWLGEAGRRPEQLRVLEEALAGYRRHGGPRRAHFARCLLDLAGAYRWAGRPGDAEPLIAEAVPLIRAKGKEVFLAEALTELGRARLDRQHPDGAEGPLLEARSLLKPNPNPPGVLAKTLEELGRLYRQTNRPADAAAAVRQIAEHWPNDPDRLYRAAQGLALCAGDSYADEALTVLKQAVGKGYADAEALRRDQAWATLWQRPEFVALIEQVAKNTSAKRR